MKERIKIEVNWKDFFDELMWFIFKLTSISIAFITFVGLIMLAIFKTTF